MTQELKVLIMKHYFQNYDPYLQDYPKLQKKTTLKSLWYINNLVHLCNIYLLLLFSSMAPIPLPHFSGFPEHLYRHFFPLFPLPIDRTSAISFALIPNFWHAWSTALLSFISDGALLMSSILHRVTHAASGLICG